MTDTRISSDKQEVVKGKKICAEMIQQLRDVPGVAGVHVMAYRQEEYVSDIVHESGVLSGRAPWRREFTQRMQAVERLS